MAYTRFAMEEEINFVTCNTCIHWHDGDPSNDSCYSMIFSPASQICTHPDCIYDESRDERRIGDCGITGKNHELYSG